MDDADILRALSDAGLPEVDAATALEYWKAPATCMDSDAIRVQSVIDSLSK